MIRLFKTIQARKITAPQCFPELKNWRIKKPKTAAQKKRVPPYLTRTIVLKLKEKQCIYDPLALASVKSKPYRSKGNTSQTSKHQNEGKHRSKQDATKEVTSPLVVTSKGQRDQYNKKVSRLKDSVNNNIANTKATNVLQKKTKLTSLLDRVFFKIAPFFNILQKFTGLLLKKNAYPMREVYPFTYANLKGASTIGGFKKVLYNKVLVQDRRLKPGYNRRKHNLSHWMVVQSQFARLGKVFIYLGKNKLASMIGLVLKTAYSAVPPALSRAKTKRHNYFNNKRLVRANTVPKLVSVIESQVAILLWRNQFHCSLTKSRRDYRQGVSSLYIVCKKNKVILLKE